MRRGFQAKNLDNSVRKRNNQEQSYQDNIFNRDTRYLKENKTNKIMLKHTFAPCIEEWFYPQKQFLWKWCSNTTDHL